MKPNTPMLMLSLLIPVTPDIDPEQITALISGQIAEALRQFRTHMAEDASDEAEETTSEEGAFQEMLEPFSAETREDLLAGLGYDRSE